jgi:hypothetical protein
MRGDGTMILLPALLLSAQPVEAPAAPPEPHAFANFSRAFPSGGGAFTRIEIALLDPAAPGQRPGYLFREMRGHRIVRIASTRTCPAAWAVVDRIEVIGMPWLDAPGAGRASGSEVLDGADYVLEAPALHPSGMAGRARIESNGGTALADWVDAMMRTLEPCWTAPL